MRIAAGQIYRHKTLEESGPSETRQLPNRFRVVWFENGYVATVRDGTDEQPTRRDIASFEEQFELISG